MDKKTAIEYLTFKKMVYPVVMQVLFWLAFILVVIKGFSAFSTGFFTGILTLVLGVLALRVFFELFMVFFKIYDRLSEIKTVLEEKR